jgi:hypothetical protein
MLSYSSIPFHLGFSAGCVNFLRWQMSTAHPAPAQARVGFQTSIDAVQKQMYSTNNVAGVKRIHEWIPRGRVPNDYNGELVQLMSRDAPPLLTITSAEV